MGQKTLERTSKKVQNKHAHYNGVFDDGNVMQIVKMVKEQLYLGVMYLTPCGASCFACFVRRKGKGLVCEGNHYDVKKTGIGWHGDSERKK